MLLATAQHVCQIQAPRSIMRHVDPGFNPLKKPSRTPPSPEPKENTAVNKQRPVDKCPGTTARCENPPAALKLRKNTAGGESALATVRRSGSLRRRRLLLGPPAHSVHALQHGQNALYQPSVKAFLSKNRMVFARMELLSGAASDARLAEHAQRGFERGSVLPTCVRPSRRCCPSDVRPTVCGAVRPSAVRSRAEPSGASLLTNSSNAACTVPAPSSSWFSKSSLAARHALRGGTAPCHPAGLGTCLVGLS